MTIATNQFLLIASDYKPWPGGIAEYLDTLARALMCVGDTINILAVVESHEKERIEFLESYEPWVTPFELSQDVKPSMWLGRKFVSGLEILRCLSPNCRRMLATAPVFARSTALIEKLEQVLLDKRPTTVIFGHLDVKLYALALSLADKGIPYGIIGHGSGVERFSNDKRNDLIKKRAMLFGASWIAANSQHTKSLFELLRIPSEKVKVILPPISEEAMRESAVLDRVVREDDIFSLVTICRLVRLKGVDIAIRAVKILAGRGIPFQYVIGGDGPERESLETLVDELELRDKVRFTGLVGGKEKWSLLRSGQVFLMPSHPGPKIEEEGFGIVFAEAAAFGLPAVGTRTGGIPDVVVDGETGILVAGASPSDVADALTFFCRNPEGRNKMGMAARTRAREEFSPQTVAARFRELVKETPRSLCVSKP